jgi:hypothetical protein
MTEDMCKMVERIWYKEQACHADFVQMIRGKLNKKVAQNVLEYLLSKYVEYTANLSGQVADGLPSKLWNFKKNREMEPLQGFELLQDLQESNKLWNFKENREMDPFELLQLLQDLKESKNLWNFKANWKMDPTEIFNCCKTCRNLISCRTSRKIER